MWPVRTLCLPSVFLTVFCRHQAAIKSLDVYLTSDLCVRKIFWTTLKRMIGKGREGLRNGEGIPTGSHSLVEEVRHSHLASIV